MAKYDNKKSHTSQLSDKFLICRAHSRDDEIYNKIASLQPMYNLFWIVQYISYNCAQ